MERLPSYTEFAEKNKCQLLMFSIVDVILHTDDVLAKIKKALKGNHVAPFEIKNHTEIVLKALEDELIKAGSSMEKVLKVNVYLDKIEDYQGMNETYRGRFGNKPPVRTTVAVAKGGVPGDSLVEMDCIAYI